jgi:uncharacterized protein (TIGR03083 family)
MECADLLQASSTDGRGLLAAASGDWARPVPHCPEWDAAGLVRHMGGILRWMAAVVSLRTRVDRRTLDAAPEAAPALPHWYLASLDQTLAVLGSADPQSETWTFSSTGDRTVAWWCRRLATEIAIHRWDAEHAVAATGGSRPEPIDGDVAAAGIEEFVVEFLPGLLAQPAREGIGGTLHLHATDGPVEWHIDLDAGGTATKEHAKADTAVRGHRSDLLLWLTNRGPLDTIEVFGASEIISNWSQIVR